MILIPTTATRIEKLQKQAKSIRNSGAHKYQTALDLVAKEAGYDSWSHVRWCHKQKNLLQKPPLTQAQLATAYYEKMAKGAITERLPVKGDAFHAVEIDGHCFYAMIGADPFVTRRIGKTRGSRYTGWVQLGRVTTIIRDPETNAWSICKYIKPRVPLTDLTFAAIHAVAYEFGISIKYHPDDLSESDWKAFGDTSMSTDSQLFFNSPAFQSLRKYAAVHPRIIKPPVGGSYLGDWAGAATKQLENQ